MPKLTKREYRTVASRLQDYLSEHLDDVSVCIGDDLHYPGVNIVVTSPRFQGLLPEQRFYLILRAMPPEFYDERLRGAGVWFELAPGETGKDLMKMPRSEDIAGREAAIRQRLEQADFANRLHDVFEEDESIASEYDYAACKKVLRDGGWSEAQITEACLLFVAEGAYCDVQVRDDLLPRWAEE